MKPSDALFPDFSFTGWEAHAVSPSLGLAESKAMLHDRTAKHFEDSGRGELAASERKEAAWWRDLLSHPDGINATQAYDEVQATASDAVDVLLARAEKYEGAAIPLASILGQLLNGMHALAANGNTQVARLLMNRVGEAVNDFELLANHKPEIFREWTRRCPAIPAMIAPYPAKQKDNVQFLEKLEVAQAFKRFAISKRQRWKFATPANLLAARLVSFIQARRESCDVEKIIARKEGTVIPEWIQEAVVMPDFSAETWKRWAEMGWRIIGLISPEGRPELHPAFQARETKICNVRKGRVDPYFGKLHNSRSIAEHDIKEALFAGFEQIATGESPRNKQRKKASPTKRVKSGK